MRLYCIIIICLYSSIDIRINGDTLDQATFGLGPEGKCTFLCWCWNHSCYWLPHRHGKYQFTWYFVIQLRNPFYVTILFFSFLGDVSSREWHLPLGLLLNSQFWLQWLSFYQLLNFGTHKTRIIKNYTRAVIYFFNSHFLPFW